MKNRSVPLTALALLLGLSLINASNAAQEVQQADAAGAASARCPAQVKVIGAVRAPSRLELRRRVRLVEALAFVGGLTELAGKQVRIIHAAPQVSDCDGRASKNVDKSFESKVESLDIAAVTGGDEKANPYLRHGDTVAVSEAGVAYIVGAVANPQPIILREPVTLTQAIAKAGGILSGVATDKIYIHRQRPGNATQTDIHVNLTAIIKRRAEDLLLQPYDVVEVRHKRAHSRPLRLPYMTPPVLELPLRIVR